MDVHFFLRTLGEQINDLLQDFPSLASESRAFVAWVLLQIVGVGEDELLDSVVDGPDDKGIDAICMSDEGRKLVVVQAKRPTNTQRNLPAVDIVKTLNGVDWLLNGDLGQADNQAFKARAEEFRDAFVSLFPPRGDRICVHLPGTCQGRQGRDPEIPGEMEHPQ